MNRDEYLAFAKVRAHEYVKRGDLSQAVTSMLSDLSKHEELRGIGEKLSMLGLFAVRSRRETERFIDGFN